MLGLYSLDSSDSSFSTHNNYKCLTDIAKCPLSQSCPWFRTTDLETSGHLERQDPGRMIFKHCWEKDSFPVIIGGRNNLAWLSVTFN